MYNAYYKVHSNILDHAMNIVKVLQSRYTMLWTMSKHNRIYGQYFDLNRPIQSEIYSTFIWIIWLGHKYNSNSINHSRPKNFRKTNTNKASQLPIRLPTFYEQTQLMNTYYMVYFLGVYM